MGIFENVSKPEIERRKKAIVKVFKDNGLSIVVQCNIKSVDFLVVTFNLNKSYHKPYRKPNNKPLYLNVHSNHPPNVLKQLPLSIEKRISDTSSNEDIFKESISIYKDALLESGIKKNLKYVNVKENQSNVNKRNRKRKIIWFNPPYSLNVKTNIGKHFLKLILKHFPSTNPMHKIFNKNTVKISYSCTRNIGAIISSHNKNILHPKQDNFGCNCRVKADCPLEGKCLTPNVIYRADVCDLTSNESDLTNNESKFYIGLAETTFKERYNNHKKDIKHEKYKNSTELTKYIWSLKNQNHTYSINWKILSKVYGNANTKMCNLCTSEKLLIIESIDDDNLLNKRSEFVSKCRHINKFMLKNIKKSGVT